MLMNGKSNKVCHALSVDVEDWYQSTYDPTAPLTDRFVASTSKMLEELGEANVKATFFILGLAAEKAPQLVKAIADQGHEVQSHGYGHRSNFEISPKDLREDLIRGKKVVEDLIGKEVYGYRSPTFSIDQRNLWVLDLLAETGHRYDSSIFPIKTSRYGIAGILPQPHIVTTESQRKIVEAPVASFYWMGRHLPVGGGGYFRLWPYWVIRKAWRQLEKAGNPGIVYMHPSEYDPSEMDAFRSKTSRFQRLHQGLGRKGFARKVHKLLLEFTFAPINLVLASLLSQIT
jgi:polysaccharide deacetylase family protein (PEP-CTERM system associated)